MSLFAGKTTLIDVLAQRKTTGVTGGDIRLNGSPVNATVLARVTGYCEQDDVHYPTATVREALHFSAALRLSNAPGTGSAEHRRREFVGRVLRLLELDVVADRMVATLSRGERKRLTIGVEMVASPSLLFLG